MARNIIRPVPLYVNGRKIAAVMSGTYELSANAEAAFGGVDGYLGHLDGWPTVKIAPSVVMPVSGFSFAVESFLLDGVPLQVGIPLNGRFHRVDVRVVGVSYKWDHKTGAVTGDLSFEGGAPELVGDIEVATSGTSTLV